MSPSSTSSADSPEQPAPGRTPPLDPAEAERAFRRGIALFNGVRYWHAHEEWERLWRAAPDAERDFYQGLIQVAAGLLHLQRKNLRGARTKLTEGLERLKPYQPAHQGVFVNELIGEAGQAARGSRGRRPAVPHPAGHPLHRRGRARLQPMTDDAETRVERDSMGEVRVPASAKWRAQTQRAVENFPISGRGLERIADRGAGPDQGGGRIGQARRRHDRAGSRRCHHRRRRRGRRRRARRPVPDRRLPDRLGDEQQHEHERGARHARIGAAGSPGASERRRQPPDVVERHVPGVDPRRGHGRRAGRPRAGSRAPRHRPRSARPPSSPMS